LGLIPRLNEITFAPEPGGLARYEDYIAAQKVL